MGQRKKKSQTKKLYGKIYPGRGKRAWKGRVTSP